MYLFIIFIIKPYFYFFHAFIYFIYLHVHNIYISTFAYLVLIFFSDCFYLIFPPHIEYYFTLFIY